MLTISAERLSRIYQSEQMTIDQIARELGCSATTIRCRLHIYNIERRSRGPRVSGKRPSWSSELAYLIGLLATDGNLSKKGYGITYTSSDSELLDIFIHYFQLNFDLRVHSVNAGSSARIQWRDKLFYSWLEEIGLMPCKSTQLGPLSIPSGLFPDFVRGCFDGDGNINIYFDQRTSYKNKTYGYQQLSIRLTSASYSFLDWIQIEIMKQTGAKGGIYAHKVKPNHNPYWDLKYGKKDSIRILKWMYNSPTAPCLSRKYEKAKQYIID